LFQLTIPLQDIRISGTDSIDLSNLPVEEASRQIKELYAFLSEDVTVEFQGNSATVQANVESELDNRGQRLLDKAVAEANRGQYSSAMSLFEQVLRQAPAHTIARRNLGMAHLEQGKVDEAERYIVETLRLDPQDAWSLLLLGNIYFQHRGDIEMAADLYQQAAAAAPNDPYLLSNLGSLYAQRGENEEARIYFRRSIAADPTFPSAYYNLAVLENQEANAQGVIQVLDEMFDQPESLDIRTDPVYENAQNLYRKARFDLAEADYKALMAFISQKRDELEQIGGVEIELVPDNSLTVTARTLIAWHHRAPRHIVRYKDANPAMTPHIIAHEFEHILMEHEAREEERNRFFITTSQTIEKARGAIAGDIYKLQRSMPQDVIDGYVQNLLQGFADRLFNMPLDMIIETRLYGKYPQLRSSQFVSLYQEYRDGLRSLQDPDTKRHTPRLIYNAALAMEAGYALFIDHLWHGRTNYATAYQSTRHYREGQKLFALWLDAKESFKPGDEYNLVDQIAQTLRVQGWYSWKADEEGPAEEVGGITNQELLEAKEMASVMYCLSALRQFENMNREEIQQIVGEIALLGARGLDYSSSDKKYTLSALPDDQFSGLELMCMMYVGFKDIDPTLDIGVDLSRPYEMALKMYTP
jgi:tetratricopeptide (TPR) repeat protein